MEQNYNIEQNCRVDMCVLLISTSVDVIFQDWIIWIRGSSWHWLFVTVLHSFVAFWRVLSFICSSVSFCSHLLEFLCGHNLCLRTKTSPILILWVIIRWEATHSVTYAQDLQVNSLAVCWLTCIGKWRWSPISH